MKIAFFGYNLTWGGGGNTVVYLLNHLGSVLTGKAGSGIEEGSA